MGHPRQEAVAPGVEAPHVQAREGGRENSTGEHMVPMLHTHGRGRKKEKIGCESVRHGCSTRMGEGGRKRKEREEKRERY